MKLHFNRSIHLLGLAAAIALAMPGDSKALALGVDFAADYTVASLGSVAGLPSNYGGLTFLNNSTLLIGGAANTDAGRLYTVGVVRDLAGHITGFSGVATQYGTGIGDFNDGGVAFGPGGVLFTSRWPVNGLGQTKPGSTDEDKIIDLTPLGVVGSSHAALAVVPVGFSGQGQLKLVSWAGGEFYSASLAPDGSGTFDLVGLAQVDLDTSTLAIDNLPGGPEGFVYIDGANDGFGGADSMLVSDYSDGQVSAYQIDANGNPILSSRRNFLTGLTGAEGAAIDPLTGDFLFSTFGGGSQVVVVQGFIAPVVPCGVPGTPPCNNVPEPGTVPLVAIVLMGLGCTRWMRRRH